MKLVKTIAKEFSLLSVFAVLGAALLTSVWLMRNFQSQFFEDFRHDRISVVLEDVSIPQFREFLGEHEGLMSYELQTPQLNQEQLQDAYPELKGIFGSLEEDFFPNS